MGDVLSLIEKAQATLDQEKSQKMVEKLAQGADLTLEDFLDQMQQVRKMGPLDQLLGMLPGMGSMKKMGGLEVDEKQLARVEAIIQSMTPAERRNPSIIDGSRRGASPPGAAPRCKM